MFRLQGTDGMRFVEPHERVELLRQRGFRVVALQLGVWTVDDADEAFEARLEQATPETFVPAEFEQAARRTCVVEETFIAVRPRRTHRQHFHFGVPIRRGGDGAGVRTESN